MTVLINETKEVRKNGNWGVDTITSDTSEEELVKFARRLGLADDLIKKKGMGTIICYEITSRMKRLLAIEIGAVVTPNSKIRTTAIRCKGNTNVQREVQAKAEAHNTRRANGKRWYLPDSES